MVKENFQIYVVQITRKCICESVKKSNLDIFMPLGTTLPNHFQAEENYSSSPSSIFSKIYPPSRKGRGEETMVMQ